MAIARTNESRPQIQWILQVFSEHKSKKYRKYNRKYQYSLDQSAVLLLG
jgi:hypothetical protein